METSSVAESIASAISGAFGASFSCLLLYPLDSKKTRKQAGTASNVESLFETYAGVGAKLVHAACSQFVFFCAYTCAKKVTRRLERGRDATSAFIAAATTVLATHSIDTWATRRQASSSNLRIESSRGRKDEIGSKKEGGSEKDGMLAALVLTINPVLQYSVYEALRYRVLHRQVHKHGKNRSEIGSATVFTIAAASKCIATLLTYPLVRAKVLQQVGRVRGNLGKVLLIVLSREGLEGWYRGLKEQMLKTVLQAAIMLSIKEKLDQLQRGLVRTWMRRRNVKQIRLD